MSAYAKIRDFCLRGLWVLSYSFLVMVFGFLRRFETDGRNTSTPTSGNLASNHEGKRATLTDGSRSRNDPGTHCKASERFAESLILCGIAALLSTLAGTFVLLAAPKILMSPLLNGGSSQPFHEQQVESTPDAPPTSGWQELPATDLKSVCPADLNGYSFSFHCQNVIAAWSGGIADTRRNRLVLWGGGHNDYYGNEIYALDLNSKKLMRLNDPSPMNTYQGSCMEALSDGKPNSRHTYGGLAYIAHADKMFVFGGSLACGPGHGGADTWTLDLATLQWKRMDPTAGGRPTGVNLAAVSDYDPTTKRVYLHDRQTLWSYTLESNTYADISEFPISVHASAVIDPKRRLFFIVGRSDQGEPQWLAVNIAPRGGHGPQDWTPKLTGCDELARSPYPGLAYDSALDRIVAWANEEDTGAVFLFDPDSKTCVKQRFSSGPPSSPKTRGVFGRWRYFPGLDLFAVVGDWQQNSYIFRLVNHAGRHFPSSSAPAPTPTSTGSPGGSQSVSAALGVPRRTALPTSTASASPADTDFSARCAMPGVVRCYGFDDPTDAAQYLNLGGGVTPKLGAIDLSMKVSGAGSLRFTIPSQSAESDAGSFPINFSPDLSVQFGEGEEFYIQWRQRFSSEFLGTVFNEGEGWKQVIISNGDRPGHIANACTDLEIVVQDTKQRGFPQLYHSCGAKDGHYEPLTVYRNGLYELQNATKPPCVWNQERFPPCVGYKPDQWMTFQVRIKIGKWYKNDKQYREDSTIQLWVGEEGKPSKLVIDFNPKSGDAGGYDLVNTDPAERYGKIWLTPFHTHKDPKQVHPVGHVWYEELIVSRSKIPDPGQSSADGPRRKN